VLKGRTEIERMAEEHAELLHRYRQMLAKTHFAGPAKADLEWPLPSFGNTAAIARLHRAVAVLAIDDGRDEAGLQAMFAALRLHRTAFHEANTLIEKMIALGAIRQEVRLLAQVAAWRPQMARRRQAEIALLLGDPDPADLDFSQVWEFEYRATGRMFIQLSKDRHGLEPAAPAALLQAKPFYLPGETLKLLTAQHDATRARLQKPGANLIELEKAAQKAFNEQLFADVGLPLLWNGTGKLLFGLASPDFAQHLARAYDTVALMRAARAQVKAVAENLPANQLTALLQSPGYVHPLTGKAPQWDAAKHILTVPVMHVNASGTYTLPMAAY
jgi:hypothetical protein